MRASNIWTSSHASRLKERVVLLEGAQRISISRLPRYGCATASMSPRTCCKRPRYSSTLASRMAEPRSHISSNRHSSSTMQFSSLMGNSSFEIGVNFRGSQLIERGIRRTNISSSSSRALGATNLHFNCANVSERSWKYDYRSFHSRLFGTDAGGSSSTAKPDPTGHIDDSDTTKEGKGKTTVPKEIIDAIKSEVDEMEASSSSPPLHSHDQQFARVKKTQDDFASYLEKGDEIMLEGDVGLGVKRQNFSQNEFNRRAKSSSSSANMSVSKREDVLQSESSASATSATGNITSDSDNDNNNMGTENKPPKEQSDSPPSQSMYKFSPTDATLSDPKRHIDRRLASEQKLQDQQAESHAATMKNVQRALGGNFIIAAAKLAAALSSGSSAMLSEFVHSVVDCGNQVLLLVGLKRSQYAPDRSHPYGYGKAIYFWALVSALGTFFLGAGVSGAHAVGQLMDPSMNPTEVTKEVWGVLIMSFAVDGYVFGKTVQGVKASMRLDDVKSKGMSFWKYATTKVRDPATLAVLLEDGAACLGIVLAIGGIGMTQYTGLPVFDGAAGVCIAGLLGAMGVALAKVNHRFLIGQGLDRATREDIEKIILNRRSIDNVYSVQSQWTGPDTFSYKAEVDFDGTFLAAKLLPRYQQEFFDAKQTLDRDLRVLLSWYAEDVMRAVEREVRHIEEEIRIQHPAAQYIELEPMSKDADRYAIDDGMEAQLRRVEIDVLNRYLRSLYKMKDGGPAGTDSSYPSPSKADKKGK